METKRMYHHHGLTQHRCIECGDYASSKYAKFCATCFKKQHHDQIIAMGKKSLEVDHRAACKRIKDRAKRKIYPVILKELMEYPLEKPFSSHVLKLQEKIMEGK